MKAKAKRNIGLDTENKWEKTGNRVLIEFFNSHLMYKTNFMKKEAITFSAASVKYTPDFMHVFECGEIAFIEVKTTRFHRSYTYTMTRVNVIAHEFPVFHFIRAILANDGWDVTYLGDPPRTDNDNVKSKRTVRIKCKFEEEEK
jgi:hypothetical protein